MGFFSNTFAPAEAKLVRLKVETFLNAHTGPYGLEVQKAVAPMLEQADILVRIVQEQKRDPDEVALSIIYNKMAACLCNGWYHTYRGILSGTGHEMLAIWIKAAEALEKRGDIKAGSIPGALQELREAIRNAG